MLIAGYTKNINDNFLRVTVKTHLNAGSKPAGFCHRYHLCLCHCIVVKFPCEYVSGLKEYIGANPSLSFESSATVVQSKLSDVSTSSSEFEDLEVQDEFYDAIAGDSASSSEDEESEDDTEKKVIPFCLRENHKCLTFLPKKS